MTNRITTTVFPHLGGLGLSSDELTALARQGFIRSEMRGSKKTFRLRYRVNGRQRVRYVSPNNVAALEAELASWQRQVRARRKLNGLSALARMMLAHRKTVLAPLVDARGYHFHGHQIRRLRNP
jgi:hypothetical protein